MEVLRKAGLLAVIGVSVGAIGCSFGEPQTSELEGERVRETANAAVDAAGETAQGALLLERQAYIEQLTTIGYPANEYNCPIKADDPCAMVNILVELPRPTELMSVGHTGIAISRLDRDPDPGVDDLYYDFGPGEELTPGQGYSFDLGLYRKYHGRPWWDHPKHFDKASAGEVGFKDIVDDLDNLAGDHTVMRIPICVGKEHAKRIVSFWENEIYKDPMPVYSVPGTHCTSTVARSF